MSARFAAITVSTFTSGGLAASSSFPTIRSLSSRLVGSVCIASGRSRRQ